MTLASTIVTDATTVFTSTDDFAEPVTYYPVGGGSRSINAVVIREPYETVSEVSDISTPAWQVHVANSASAGIASTEIDTGGDEIGLPFHEGQAATRRPIVSIVHQDAGMLVLELR